MQKPRRWALSPASLLYAAPDDTWRDDAYMLAMRTLLYGTLFALLALSFWFAGSAFVQMSGDPIPLYGYVAIAGGVLVSLAVGGGLMALVFYSNRHGYDDLSGGDGGKTP
jgi:hypothetical protein